MFVVAGLYDAILGLLFLSIPVQVLEVANLSPPDFIGYIQFPAFFLIIFAMMFFNIAKDPIANKNLIMYAVLLKFSYCAVVFSHWFLGDLPYIWLPFAFFDVGFFILFILAYRVIED